MSHERNVVSIYSVIIKECGLDLTFYTVWRLHRHSIVFYVMKRVKIIHTIICEGN